MLEYDALVAKFEEVKRFGVEQFDGVSINKFEERVVELEQQALELEANRWIGQLDRYSPASKMNAYMLLDHVLHRAKDSGVDLSVQSSQAPNLLIAALKHEIELSGTLSEKILDDLSDKDLGVVISRMDEESAHGAASELLGRVIRISGQGGAEVLLALFESSALSDQRKQLILSEFIPYGKGPFMDHDYYTILDTLIKEDKISEPLKRAINEVLNNVKWIGSTGTAA